VTPGVVFFAVRGERVDGHAFISSAVDRGAVAVVCETNGSSPARVAKVKVADTRAALARAAAAFYREPSGRMAVVGVTGTNGKTTVAFMVKQLFEASGLKSGLLGTVRYEIGDRMIPAQRTTPESLEAQEMLAQMVRAGCGACVMEVSSHALEQHRVDRIEFDTGVFTNLTQDHLDFHGTMERYFAAKKKLFAQVESGAKRGGMVFNLDDPYGRRLSQAFPRDRQTTCGAGLSADVRVTDCQLEAEGSRLEIGTPAGLLRCRLPLIGRHNVDNALAAVAVALRHGIALDVIQETLGRLRAVPGRMERVDCGQPFAVLVDYAHTDDALRHALQALRELTTGRLLLVFGCGGSRDTGKRAKMGRVAAELADATWITNDNPRKEQPEAIAEQIQAGYRAVRTDACQTALDRGRALDEAMREARAGDTVLIAGKGHETYQEFGDTVIPFDDRMRAAEALATLGWTRRKPK
jgi:UDP-N-acetylmuramoyl-L-alanyl-D-glutamate--2,6-diaminopimelate ligase